MPRSFTALTLSAALALLPAMQGAQAQDYTPDIIELDGGNSLAFEPSQQLVLADGGTVEFWVSPDWARDPGYDPVIICNAGPQGASYLIAMLRDRDGLAFAAGEQEAVFAFDFTDGQLHHVALSQLQDGIVVLVDGRVVGASPVSALDLPSYGVWVGSIDGVDNPFQGAIAGLRFWDRVVEREDLVKYALKDVFQASHPDLAGLSAMSDFANKQLLLVE